MGSEMSEYKFGECLYCHEDKPLKDGVCLECQDNVELPDFMKNLFGGFDK
jgi:hypothetical protein